MLVSSQLASENKATPIAVVVSRRLLYCFELSHNLDSRYTACKAQAGCMPVST